MRFARDSIGQKIEVQYSGQRANCGCCASVVVGKMGRIRPKYWSHLSSKECDSWYEPITQWHIDWQNQFPKQCQEIEMVDSNGMKHRADVRLKNGNVIEVQNSQINIDEIEQREKFYNSNGQLYWILNGGNLLKNCTIKYKTMRKGYYISIYIPEYTNESKYYDFDKIREKFLESSSVIKLKSLNPYKNEVIRNGTEIRFNFEHEINLSGIVENLKNDAHDVIINHYEGDYWDICSEMKFDYYSESNDYFYKVQLTKLYWRKFIDEMKSPVYIDNLNGLADDHIFYYQKNRIVKKRELISSLI